MSDWKEVLRFIHVPRIEAAAWVTTSVLTIITDFTIAIAVGMLIGTFLYIRKKASDSDQSRSAPQSLS